MTNLDDFEKKQLILALEHYIEFIVKLGVHELTRADQTGDYLQSLDRIKDKLEK